VHVPIPSHADAISTPAVQVAAGPHVVPATQSWHAPALQVPSVLHMVSAVCMQRPRGSALPSVEGAQVPSATPVSEAAHAWQAVLQALLQQNPSTQLPRPQSASAVQEAPTGSPLLELDDVVDEPELLVVVEALVLELVDDEVLDSAPPVPANSNWPRMLVQDGAARATKIRPGVVRTVRFMVSLLRPGGEAPGKLRHSGAGLAILR
jgi:hypothetical protein